MVNMKMSASEAKEWAQPTAADAPEYPYGLKIDLCEDDLAKLGVAGLLTVGSTLTMQAQVTVTSASQSETQGEGPERSITLQITDMALGAGDRQPGDRLYGGA